MKEFEEQELIRAESELITIFHEHSCFTSTDICNIHKSWLGKLYPFAGKYRTVNLSKEDFLFAPAARIADVMFEFEDKHLAKLTLSHLYKDDELACALGVVHVEFIVIHPFREDNGRAARKYWLYPKRFRAF